MRLRGRVQLARSQPEAAQTQVAAYLTQRPTAGLKNGQSQTTELSAWRQQDEPQPTDARVGMPPLGLDPLGCNLGRYGFLHLGCKPDQQFGRAHPVRCIPDQ
jgi:hypothetical protein